jgi:hypothetical protein
MSLNVVCERNLGFIYPLCEMNKRTHNMGAISLRNCATDFSYILFLEFALDLVLRFSRLELNVVYDFGVREIRRVESWRFNILHGLFPESRSYALEVVVRVSLLLFSVEHNAYCTCLTWSSNQLYKFSQTLSYIKLILDMNCGSRQNLQFFIWNIFRCGEQLTKYKERCLIYSKTWL